MESRAIQDDMHEPTSVAWKRVQCETELCLSDSDRSVRVIVRAPVQAVLFWVA